MLLRRLLGIFVVSALVAFPVAAQPDKDKLEKAVTDAEKKVTEAEKALKDNKDVGKTKDLEKAVDKAKADLEAAKKALKDAPADKKGEKALLKWKFEKGKDFYQKMYTKTTQTMKVMNNEVKQTQEQTFYFKWSIVEQKGDDWIIKQKIDAVVMNIEIGN